MPTLVTFGAQLRCSQGAAPCKLAGGPGEGTHADDQPTATVADTQPLVNIQPFGACKSTSNPQVVTATAAAQGVLTPQPCVPNTSGTWSPGSDGVTINGVAALTSGSTCKCAWAGTIEVVSPGNEVEAS